jgi:plastocyanin
LLAIRDPFRADPQPRKADANTGIRETKEEREMTERGGISHLLIKSVRAIVLASLVAAVGASNAPASSAAPEVAAISAAQKPYDWSLRGAPAGTQLDEGEKVAFTNETYAGHEIYYHERDWGINLKWRDWRLGRNVWFKRYVTGGGAIRYGERVAVYVDGGGYLRHAWRPFGITLKWSDYPVYEWEIRGVNALGSTVHYGDVIALYNRDRPAFLVYGWQLLGINLVWWQGTSPTTTANVSLGVRFPVPPGVVRCTLSVTWRLDPVSLTGSTGESSTRTFTTSADTTPSRGEGDNWYCYVLASTGNLRVGTWRIQAQTPLWATSCNVSLHAGGNSAHFTQNRSGCTTDLFNWP